MDYKKHIINEYELNIDQKIIFNNNTLYLGELSGLNFSKLKINNYNDLKLDFSGLKEINYEIEIYNSKIEYSIIENITFNGNFYINNCTINSDLKIKNSVFKNSFEIKHNNIFKNEINIQDSIFYNFDFYFNNFNILTILNSNIINDSNTIFYIKNSIGNELNLYNITINNLDLSSSRISFIDFRNIKLSSDFCYINLRDFICDKRFFLKANELFFKNCYFIFYLSRIDNFICDELDLYKIKLLSENLNFGDLKLIELYLNKDKNAISINEKRILLGIYKQLNIFGNIDNIFIEIMNLKLKIKNNIIIYKVKLIFFNYILGWGIKITNLLIFIFLYLISFGLIYNSFFNKILEENNINGFLFSFLSFFSIIIPEKDITKLDGILIYFSGFEAISGTFFITLFIAMLTRKFMKV